MTQNLISILHFLSSVSLKLWIIRCWILFSIKNRRRLSESVNLYLEKGILVNEINYELFSFIDFKLFYQML